MLGRVHDGDFLMHTKEFQLQILNLKAARKATIDMAESAFTLVTTHNNNKMKQVSAIRTCHVCFCVCVQVREREGEKDNS